MKIRATNKVNIKYKPSKLNDSLVFFVDNSGKSADDQSIYMMQTTEKALKQKSRKGKIINLVCFVLSIVVLVVTLLIQQRTFGVHDISTLQFSKKFFLYTLLAFAGIMVCDSVRTHLLIHRSTGEHRPFLAYKSTAICRYYDCITPFSFGGQPFQIYYLSSRGVRGGVASSVPLAKYIYSQLAFCLISTVLLFVGIFKGLFANANTQTIITFSIVTLVICILFLAAIFFISLSKRVTPKVVWRLIGVGSKIKLIKNKEIAFARFMRTILEYQKSIKFYMKSILVTIFSFALSVGIILLKGLIPYLIYLTFVEVPTVDYFTILILYNVCELVTMFIPLPGGSGVAELSFTALFAAMFPDSYIVWAMLFFRFFTYYIYILQGFAVNIYDIILGNHNNDKYLMRKQLK